MGHRPRVGPVVRVPPERTPGEHALGRRCTRSCDTLWDRDLLVVVALVLAGRRVRACACRAAPAIAARRRDRALLGRRRRGWCSGSRWCSRCSCRSPRCGGPTSPTSCRRSRCSPRCGQRRGRCCSSPGWWQRRSRSSNNRSILWPDGYTGAEAALVHRLERVPARRARDQRRSRTRVALRPPPAGSFVDPSFQRIDDGDITKASLVRQLRAAPTSCGVISVVADALQALPTRSLGRARSPHIGLHPRRPARRVTDARGSTLLRSRPAAALPPVCASGERRPGRVGRTSAAAAPRRSPG